MKGISTRVLIVAAAVVVAALTGVLVWRAQGEDAEGRKPIAAVVAAHRDQLMALEGVTEVSVGESGGQPVIALSVDPDTPVSNVPGSIDGYDVITTTTGVVSPEPGGGGQPGNPGSEPGSEPPDGGSMSEPGDPADPGAASCDPADLVRGVVKDIRLGRELGDTTSEIRAEILVEDATGPAGDKVVLSITPETKLFRATDAGPSPMRTDDLAEVRTGTNVEILITGPIRESYPTQATAAEVVFLD